MRFSQFLLVVILFIFNIAAIVDSVKPLCTPSMEPVIKDCNMCWCIGNGIPLCSKLPCEKIPNSLWGQLTLAPQKQKRFFMGGMMVMMMAKCAIIPMVLMKGVLIKGAMKAIMVAAAMATGPAMFALKSAIGMSVAVGSRGIMALMSAACGAAVMAMRVAGMGIGTAVNVGIPLIGNIMRVGIPMIGSTVSLAISFGFRFITKCFRGVGQLTGIMKKSDNYVNNYYPNNNICYQPCNNNYNYCSCVNYYNDHNQCHQQCHGNNAYCSC